MAEVTIEQAIEAAIAHHRAGDLREAEQVHHEILAQFPDHPDALHLMGLVQLDLGRGEQACKLIERAISINGTFADFHRSLGDARLRLEQFEQAEASYCRALELRPDYAEVYGNLGNLLYHRGRVAEAIAAFRQSIDIDPTRAHAHYSLGAALLAQKEFRGAIESLQRAAALSPNDKATHHNLAAALMSIGQFDKAEQAMNRVLALDPDNADLWNNLSALHKMQGKLDQAVACGRCAVELAPRHASFHSNLLMTMNYHGGFSNREIVDEHERWAERHETPLRAQIGSHDNDRSPDRRLRIGYVSPDFLEHPVGYFIEPIIREHNRRNVEVFCYSDFAGSDALNTRLKADADHWRETKGIDDARVAEMIREDRIDILIDLAGHTANNRLLVFARKPAPVQATYLGYVNTTGLRSMDYVILGPHLLPPGYEICVEKICALPKAEVCYQPRLPAVEIGELPALSRGQFTFACLNGLMKVSPATWKTWAQILHRVPNSRLILLAYVPLTASQIRELPGFADIDPGRVEFVPRMSLADYYAAHNRFDLALDPFPHCGGTTTCDALWMGVPIITLPGQAPVSRVGLSLLSSLGLDELAATSSDHYVDLAVNLANDLPRLAKLRRTLRGRMESSPLMDAPGFVRDLEHGLRTMWQTWCSSTQLL